MDINQLKNDHPDLYAQVKAEGKTESKTAVDAAVSEKQDDVMALVKCIAGDDVHNKVNNLVKIGITAQQAEALKGSFAPVADQPTAPVTAETDGKKEILETLQQVTPGSVNSTPELSGDEPDFNVLVEAHQDKAGCSKADAIGKMMEKHPKAHGKWLQDQQKS